MRAWDTSPPCPTLDNRRSRRHLLEPHAPGQRNPLRQKQNPSDCKRGSQPFGDGTMEILPRTGNSLRDLQACRPMLRTARARPAHSRVSSSFPSPVQAHGDPRKLYLAIGIFVGTALSRIDRPPFTVMSFCGIMAASRPSTSASPPRASPHDCPVRSLSVASHGTRANRMDARLPAAIGGTKRARPLDG